MPFDRDPPQVSWSIPDGKMCHSTNRLTEGDGTAILLCCSITKIYPSKEVLASKPVKHLAVYLSFSMPLFVSDLSHFLRGDLAIHMAGDLNAKHIDWNSGLITRCRLVHDYTDQNSLCIGWITYNHALQILNTNGDIAIIITKDVTPEYLTICSTLSSDHLPILIDMQCWSSFFNLRDHTDLKRTDVQIPGLPGIWAPVQHWLHKSGGYWRVSRNCQGPTRKR